MITMAKKQEIFKKNRFPLVVMYYIADKVILRQQLVEFIMAYYHCCQSDAIFMVKEMETYSLIKSKQLLQTNNNILYLTKTAVAIIEQKKSREVATLTLTEQKIKLSIYKIQYILNYINPHLVEKPTPKYILADLRLKNSTLLIVKNKQIDIYKMLNDKFGDNLTSSFTEDYKTSIAVEEENKNKLRAVKQCTAAELIDTKEQRKKKIDMYKRESDMLKDYFNFNNFLSRNFVIESLDIVGQNLNITIGFLDILNETDTYKIYRNIGYIYNMIDRYFKLADDFEYKGFRAGDYNQGNVFNINMSVNIYTEDKRRAELLKNDSLSIIRDFYSKEKKEHGKAFATIIKITNKDVVVDKIKLNFLDLNIKRYFN